MKTIADIGEIALVERIKSFLPDLHDLSIKAGDDCAVVKSAPNSDLVLASDPVIAGVHFSDDAEPYDIGHKAVGRVLSDFAAMGAEPKWILINLVAPPETDINIIDEIYRGANELLARFGAAIVGGDVARGDKLELHVFGTALVPVGEAISRNGAGTGDWLFVTGILGGSIVGHHLDFEPRIEQGVWLRNRVTAMMDISDGLILDLQRMLKMSGVGCKLDVSKVPISPDAAEMNDGKSSLEHALSDGEDFELLFTVTDAEKDKFIVSWNDKFNLLCTCIGRITNEPGEINFVNTNGDIDLSGFSGYEHWNAVG